MENPKLEDAKSDNDRAIILAMIGQIKALINAREVQLRAELDDLLDQVMDQDGGTC